ncbi:hypothetical protein FRX31_028416 [Thalictrum thalictroides]|uniref:Uncharacterized protein n=1 Tax=Thalictrum thalictroides TaxID=46969 RepID=A0A7J6VB76_THATH|nr:hypothetical protein FRX31_028416 [Thalictrum thalictroides]
MTLTIQSRGIPTVDNERRGCFDISVNSFQRKVDFEKTICPVKLEAFGIQRRWRTGEAKFLFISLILHRSPYHSCFAYLKLAYVHMKTAIRKLYTLFLPAGCLRNYFTNVVTTPVSLTEDEQVPPVLKKELLKNSWDEEDVDENDVKESWEDEEEPTPVQIISCFAHRLIVLFHLLNKNI